VTDDVVWWPEKSGPGKGQGRVTVVTVSYNTRELTAFLLWSLRRILRWRPLQIVVVDNRSQDGSAALLADAERGGVCVLLANDVNLQHGPGLNQAIRWLASQPGPSPAWIWILDSDAVVARPEALSGALAAAARNSAALVGEPYWDQWNRLEQFGLHSLLIDPARVWRPGVRPFTDGGDPAFDLLRSAAGLGLPAAAFPFTADGHVIHRGRGSLAAVFAAGDLAHPLYSWAADHHEPHFGDVAGAARAYEALLQAFRAETGPLTGRSLASACSRGPDGLHRA
jgi:glycosyltransferase involved in cell wall biosynthesis